MVRYADRVARFSEGLSIFFSNLIGFTVRQSFSRNRTCGARTAKTMTSIATRRQKPMQRLELPAALTRPSEHGFRFRQDLAVLNDKAPGMENINSAILRYVEQNYAHFDSGFSIDRTRSIPMPPAFNFGFGKGVRHQKCEAPCGPLAAFGA